MKSFKELLDEIEEVAKNADEIAFESIKNDAVEVSCNLFLELIRRFKLAEEALFIASHAMKIKSPKNISGLIDEAMSEISKPFGDEA